MEGPERSAPSAIDCSAFVCRVAADAGLYRAGVLAPDAAWLLDHLVTVEQLSPGDIVGYGRAALNSIDDHRDVVWHVMIYVGKGTVVGACDIAGRVVARPINYEAHLGSRRWKPIARPPFRALRVA